MTIVGCLIGESLRAGSSVDGLELTIMSISRVEAGNVEAGQPRLWTMVAFEGPDDAADRLARDLERVLEAVGGWYCDFRTDEETFVVFAGRTFRYARGDDAARAAAEEYARLVGVPESQLDWPT